MMGKRREGDSEVQTSAYEISVVQTGMKKYSTGNTVKSIVIILYGHGW